MQGQMGLEVGWEVRSVRGWIGLEVGGGAGLEVGGGAKDKID